MTDKTYIGDRMKRYEEVPRTSLTPRMPMIVRVDGRAFHTYTKRLKRREASPWSVAIREAMTEVAQALLREISGAKIAYLQSDEISILVTDYDSLDTVPWFDKVSQKISSVTAAISTATFNQAMLRLEMSQQQVTVDRSGTHTFTIEFPRLATFDSRCFVLPREEVANYFVWRQRDAIKNSVSMLAQNYFSHKQLQGKNGSQKKEMLQALHDVDWDACETWQKSGWCVKRRVVRSYTEGDPRVEIIRSVVEPDWETPIFTSDPWYLHQHVYLEEAQGRARTEEIFNRIVGTNPCDEDEEEDLGEIRDRENFLKEVMDEKDSE